MFYPTSDLFTNGRIYGNVEHKLKCQDCHSVEKWGVLIDKESDFSCVSLIY